MNDAETAARRPRRPLPGMRRLTVEIVGASLALGVIVGVAWSILAPDVYGQVLENGVGIAAFDARLRFGQDAAFAALGVAAGGLLTVAFGTRYRRRPVSSLALLLVGGIAGSVLAWRLGMILGPGPIEARAAEADVGDRIVLPLEIGALGVLLTWPIAVAMVTAVLAALRDDRARWNAGNDR